MCGQTLTKQDVLTFAIANNYKCTSLLAFKIYLSLGWGDIPKNS
jgi:hypothetical protein